METRSKKRYREISPCSSSNKAPRLLSRNRRSELEWKPLEEQSYCSPSNVSHSLSIDQTAIPTRNNRKRQRTDMSSHNRKRMTLAEGKAYIELNPLEPIDPQEAERSKRMHEFRETWNTNIEVFTQILDTLCLRNYFKNERGWKLLAEHLHFELKIKTQVTEETIQSCKDYAAELQGLLKECKRLDKAKSRSKARDVPENVKNTLISIFDKKPLKLNKKHGASTSADRKSTSSGRKSSSTNDPSVHMPCTSRQRLSDALIPILKDLSTFFTPNKLTALGDFICSDPILYGAFLNYDDDGKKQFIESYLTNGTNGV